jgi:hypothetical protein
LDDYEDQLYLLNSESESVDINRELLAAINENLFKEQFIKEVIEKTIKTLKLEEEPIAKLNSQEQEYLLQLLNKIK